MLIPIFIKQKPCFDLQLKSSNHNLHVVPLNEHVQAVLAASTKF